MNIYELIDELDSTVGNTIPNPRSKYRRHLTYTEALQAIITECRYSFWRGVLLGTVLTTIAALLILWGE